MPKITIENVIPLLCLLLTLTAHADKIEDNSFLLEEAYNQESGVVQLIQSYQYTKKNSESSQAVYNLSVEMAAPNRNHQLAFTIPYTTSTDNNVTNSGVNDILLSYRYQLIDTEKIALSPRLSIVLPTGRRIIGMGTGVTGLQVNIPVSLELNDIWMNHWNFGYTFTNQAQGVSGTTGSNTISTNFATSFVYLTSDTLNLLTEFIHNSTDTSNGDGTKSRSESYYISPGFRYAINTASVQYIPGLAFPIGIAPSEPEDYSVLLYFSIEGKMW